MGGYMGSASLQIPVVFVLLFATHEAEDKAGGKTNVVIDRVLPDGSTPRCSTLGLVFSAFGDEGKLVNGVALDPSGGHEHDGGESFVW